MEDGHRMRSDRPSAGAHSAGDSTRGRSWQGEHSTAGTGGGRDRGTRGGRGMGREVGERRSGGNSSGRSQGGGDGAMGQPGMVQQRRKNWWKDLEEEDLISLEPLSALPYEPFQLNSDRNTCTWFDGKILAHYLVSTLNFTHPLSRRTLLRQECQRLDAYTKEHALGSPEVTKAFDLRDSILAERASEAELRHSQELQAQAEQILQSMYLSSFSGNSGSSSDRIAGGGRGRRDRGGGRSSRRNLRSSESPVISHRETSLQSVSLESEDLGRGLTSNVAHQYSGAMSNTQGAGGLQPYQQQQITLHFPPLGAETGSSHLSGRGHSSFKDRFVLSLMRGN